MSAADWGSTGDGRSLRRTDAQRGVSTPIDVAFGLLLVGAAISVIVGIGPTVPDTPDGRGTVLLGSAMEVSYETEADQAQVSGTMGGLLGEAVRAESGKTDAHERAFSDAVRQAVATRVSASNSPIQIIGYCRRAGMGGALIVVGESVPSEQPIQATVYELPIDSATAQEPADCQPALVVRRWSA